MEGDEKQILKTCLLESSQPHSLSQVERGVYSSPSGPRVPSWVTKELRLRRCVSLVQGHKQVDRDTRLCHTWRCLGVLPSSLLAVEDFFLVSLCHDVGIKTFGWDARSCMAASPPDP